MSELTRDEKSLLLFFETCAVDSSGRIKTAHMNATDFEIAKRWNDVGFVCFGRICSEDVSNFGSHWCELSEQAWELVSQLRKERASRSIAFRKWRTTDQLGLETVATKEAE